MELSVGPVDKCFNTKQWTEWKDRDDPTGLADTETIAGFVLDAAGLEFHEIPGGLCSNPRAAQGRVKATQQMATTQNVLMGLDRILMGLDCVNSQNDGGCVDYEVRFCCPGNTLSLFKQ